MHLAALTFAFVLAATPADRPFAVEVVDEDTGRGVPLVELETTSGVTYVTDSAGLVAFHEPGLMGQRVYFAVKSHGYEIAKDGFGFPGRAFDVKPGGSATIKVRRVNIAERLYRITGEGIYRDSVLLGRKPPIERPVLNAEVSGSDSTMNVIYRGRLHWFWGDTNWPAYPLGLFDMAGAVSRLPGDGGLDPAVGVNLEYYAGENGFARGTAPMPGEGPTWINGITVLPDATGNERMVCGYAKIKPPMEVHRRGLAMWNDESERFELVREFPVSQPLFPDGHPLPIEEGGEKYVYFSTPFPLVRVRATVESYLDLDSYEAFTCLLPGSTIEDPRIDRDESGQARYSWKRNAPPVTALDQAKLIAAGKLTAEEALLQTRDAVTGKPVTLHRGSVAWNEHRRRYVMIAGEIFGLSALGEIWYAEAPSPTGPWDKAVKIVTHDKYSFYNPKQHPYFEQNGGRTIYFEGTYTHSFSGNPHRTPRYDYNQIMYRLDLADPRLKAAQP